MRPLLKEEYMVRLNTFGINEKGETVDVSVRYDREGATLALSRRESGETVMMTISPKEAALLHSIISPGHIEPSYKARAPKSK
jgi:hypothetical protein